MANLISRLMLICALAFVSVAHAPAQVGVSRPPTLEDFVPAELIIGFEAPEYRDTFIDRIECIGQSILAGGEPPAALSSRPIGMVSLILRINFAANVEMRLRDDPVAELEVLEQIARQLKARDGKIKYAYPNWAAPF